MTPERWQQVNDIVRAALEREPGERSAFLEQACAGDEALLAEVKSRLEETSDLTGRITTAGATLPSSDPARPPIYQSRSCPLCRRQYPHERRYCPTDGQLLTLQDPYHLIGRTILGKYRIEALVGVGGMGAVYGAHHVGIDRRIAFKVLLPHLALGNPRLVDLFEREAKTAGHLNHENVANVFDAGRTADGLAYIAMEWLEGSTLAEELIAHGALSFERTADILRQVCAALGTSHALHVIHRDLKPANVMLTKRADGSEQVKVLDFGIAKVATDTAGASVSSIMGTPHYASPEQFELGGKIDGRADIYSLGVMLFQMLTGSLPFEATSMRELITLHLTSSPPPLRQMRPDATEQLEGLVSQMLAKRPEERPQSAAEVYARFNEALGLAHGLGSPVRTPIPRSADLTRTSASLASRLTRRGRLKLPLVIGSAVALLVAVAVAMHFWKGVDLSGTRRFAILPAGNVEADNDLDDLGRVAKELLSIKLSKVAGVEVMDDRQVVNALRAMGKQSHDRLNSSETIEAAKGCGAGAALTCSATRVGGHLRLFARVHDVSRGRELFSQSVEGSRAEDLFGMVDKLAEDLVRGWGLGTRGVAPVADLTTKSYEAMRSYQVGYESLLARNRPSAISNLDRATKIDPNFLLAQFRLGQAYREARDSRMEEAFTRAKELGIQQNEQTRLATEANYLLSVKKDRAGARSVFEQLVARYPKDPEALLALTDLYRESRSYDRSVEYGKRAAALDPNFGEAWNAIGYTYLLKHDYGNAIDSFKRYVEVEPSNPNAYDSLGDVYAEAHIYDDALRNYQRVLAIQPGFYDFTSRWKLGEIYFLKNQPDEATAQIEQFLRETDDLHRPLGYQTLARIEHYKGHLAGARANFTKARTAVARNPQSAAEVTVREATLLMGLHREAEALRLIDQARRLVPDKPQLGIRWRLIALALSGDVQQMQAEMASLGDRMPGELATELRARRAQLEGNFAAAIDEWKKLQEQQPAVSFGYDLARAYLVAGQPAEAERELLEFVKARPVPDLGSTSPISPIFDARYILGHYELARASEALNKRSQAVDYYRRFLAYWGEGDINVPEITQARERLSALTR
jgi:serine/threonine protein kinase/tetratricopeptide (TPR) repeat protein